MESLDNFVSKVGNDKVLHFLGGGYICSLITFMVILQENFMSYGQEIESVFIGTIAVFILSAMKEMIMDSKSDWKDVLASILGCVPVFVFVALGVLFNYLSR